MSEYHQINLEEVLPFWPHLSPNEQDYLTSHLQTAHYLAHQAIHSNQTDCLGAIIIKSGCIRIYMLSDTGKEVTLYRLYANDVCILSASCVLQHITFEIQIDAEEDTSLLVIPSSVLSKLTHDNVYVENFSYKLAVEKFSEVMWAMEQVLFMSFDKRLAVFLLEESRKLNSETIPLTHEQIAKYMGSAREVVSRMLKYFSSEGLVQLSRGSITLLDTAQLKKYTL